MSLTAEQAGPATIVRRDGDRWAPVATVPPLEDGDHDPHAQHRRVVYWHFHTSTDIAERDRLLARDAAWEFLGRCGPNHGAVHALAEIYEASIADVMSERQVWSCRPIR